MSALEARLNNRGQDNADVIKQRIGAAKEEISHYIDADYLIINDHFDIALSQLESIVMALDVMEPAGGFDAMLQPFELMIELQRKKLG